MHYFPVKRPVKRIVSGLLVFIIMATVAGMTRAQTAEREVPRNRAQIQLSYAPLVRQSAPAVVNVFTKKLVRQRQRGGIFQDPFFRRFFGPGFNGFPGGSQQRIQNSLGSGVIINSSGLIVTNRHVIKGADEIKVVLNDRREFDAKIVITDEKTDLAFLRIKPEKNNLPTLKLADSDKLAVGDLVLAIGNPFGVGQTVTSGIVSGLARTRITGTGLASFIQTDAAINPGNSGGALIGMDGKLVGINTAIYSKSGGSQGIGFAIPSNMVRAVIAGISKNGKLVRPWLGVQGQTVTQDIASSISMKRPQGILVSDIYPGSPADVAGIHIGDVIFAVNNQNVNAPETLNFRIATLEIGKQAELQVLRKNKMLSVKIGLLPPPEKPPSRITKLTGEQPLAGSVVGNLSPALAENLNVNPFQKGVIIVNIEGNTPAARFGLRVGDFIREMNGTPIKRVQNLIDFLKIEKQQWLISIQRGGQFLKLKVNR